MVDLGMRAIGNKVIVKQDPPKTEQGGILFIQGKEEYPNTGTVLHVGPQVKENIQVGDRVMFERKPETALAGGWARPEDDLYGLLALVETAIVGVLEEEGS